MELQWTPIAECDEEVVRKAALLLVAWGFTLGWDGTLVFQGAAIKDRFADILVDHQQIRWSGMPVRIIVGMRIGKTFVMRSCVCPVQYTTQRNTLPGAMLSDKPGTLFELHKEWNAVARAYTYSPGTACVLISQFGSAIFIDQRDGTSGNWVPAEIEPPETKPPVTKPPAEPRAARWRFLDEC